MRSLRGFGARLAARRDFGGVEQIKAAYRDERGLPFTDMLMQDLRYAVRTFASAPGFTCAAYTIAGSIVTLLAASLAGLLPAWRASRVDPMVELRHE